MAVSYENAVVLVTGAGGGIGSALADELAARGATVVRTDLHGAEVTLDVTDGDAVEDVVAKTVADHGRLDIAVAAAGVGVAGPAETFSLDDWRRVIDVNVWGTVHVVRSVYPRLVERQRGHLLLVASLSGLTPTPLLTPYAMTKYATVGLARSLRIEAARHGVGVTALCPGPVDTPLLDTRAAIDVRRYLTDGAGRALAPSRVARDALDGMQKNRAIVAPGRARVLALLTRLAPSAADKALAHSMTKELRRSSAI